MTSPNFMTGDDAVFYACDGRNHTPAEDAEANYLECKILGIAIHEETETTYYRIDLEGVEFWTNERHLRRPEEAYL